jgi:hypothetical protein
VVKSFAEAAEFIAVDRQQVEESVRWLAAGQNDTGCFLKVGHQRRHLISYSHNILAEFLVLIFTARICVLQLPPGREY